MNDPSANVRAVAANAFGKMADYPQLRTIAVSPDGQLARDAIVTSLAGALKDDDPAVRDEAAMSLSSYGNAAESAVSTLLDRLKTDADAGVREAAYLAIQAIQPAALDTEDPDVRRALAEMHAKGK
jgi:HEAT repeat protein